MPDIFTKAKRSAVKACGFLPLSRGEGSGSLRGMNQITLNVPETTPEALHISPERLGAELLLAAAMKLYEAGRLSGGAAAELAGVPKPVFIESLDAYGVAAFRQNAADLQDEAA